MGVTLIGLFGHFITVYTIIRSGGYSRLLDDEPRELLDVDFFNIIVKYIRKLYVNGL
jgi:hypothetical protein